LPTRYGPIYCNIPIKLEQPGPPLNHIFNGAVVGYFLAATKT